MKKKQEQNVFLSPISLSTALVIVVFVAGLFGVLISQEALRTRQYLSANVTKSISSTQQEAVASSSDSVGKGQRQRILVEGDYVIDQAGTILKDSILEVKGSVIVRADDVLLQNILVQCRSDEKKHIKHSADGITAVGVKRLKLYQVDVRGCGGNGIFLKDGAGHDLAEGSLSQIAKTAIVLDNVRYTDIAGWAVHSSDAGISLRNGSNHNRIIASIVWETLTGNPFFISEDSSANQIVRSRNRNVRSNVIAAIDLNPDNLWYHSVCNSTDGYAACTSDNAGKAPDYNDPLEFSPVAHTVCLDKSFQGHTCSFQDVGAALDAATTGDLVTIDTNTNNNDGSMDAWPVVRITKPLWIVGNNRSQQGAYGYKVNFSNIIIDEGAKAGTRLQNIFVDKPASEVSTALDGVELINVQARGEGGKWVLVK
ncbi:MAG: hypothetical protein A2756_05885 [Candidatus Ryanbacteria bacterium RIFCSPHIGHO2_01_FULL_48_27]|uniref:Uncharacterized protein n=1 Tax=Candidatus Ryanbacteria bacterium RIFCSPHIGHO2_01_FULL_48_27 TaxID=1802115 RepID=A0A1G2G791_9BACT|nr:MAG: hypothetical protein A2756_05885 [Candidatus Ryanbacteria bacterium RIFCSPHIGHO2_01_FULL_48_27]